MTDHQSSAYDLVVVGAGINGVGIALDAALRGLRVVLVEMDDICSGVSAWSGRLIHGGLRYLEHYDFGLVHESLVERERLFQNAPHLVRPVPLLMPTFDHNRRPGWLVELGMVLYDTLSLRKTPPAHRHLGRSKTQVRFPGIASEGLKGAALFYDGQLELAERLCLEIALDAADHGAELILHTRVDRPIVEDRRVVGVHATNTITGEEIELRAPVVYNVAGPWIDRVFTSDEIPVQPRLNGGAKGSHLVVERFKGAPNDVVYYESRRDGRLVLVIPWMGRVMIGTTDVRFEDDPGRARCDIGEAEYLLNEVNALIPDAKLTIDDVLYTLSGVRPLPYEPGIPESSITRSHVLHDHASTGLAGLVTVIGGKLTTYRQLAEDAVDDVMNRLGRRNPGCLTRRRALLGAVGLDAPRLRAELLGRGAPPPVADRLLRFYGSAAREVWSLAETDPALARIVHTPSALLGAELVHAVTRERAVTLTDVLARRVLLAFEPGHGLDVVGELAAMVGERLGWDEHRRAHEVEGYRTWLDHLAIPDPGGPRSSSFGAGATEAAGALR